jgi:AAA+ superfamily predicted ATPase
MNPLTLLVFLRKLEYFQGILFLTTNRLETIDLAFQLRINLAIQFRPFTEDNRGEVCSHFIKKLGNEAELELCPPNYIADLVGHDLNGRQIRNIVNLARSLASVEAGGESIKVGRGHINQALCPTEEFQTYFAHNRRSTQKGLMGGGPWPMSRQMKEQGSNNHRGRTQL